MDHIDLVEPVGESLEAGGAGSGGLTPPRKGQIEVAQEYPAGLQRGLVPRIGCVWLLALVSKD